MTAGKQATWQRVEEESLESWPYGRVTKREIRLEAEISKRTEDLAGTVNWGGGKVRSKVPPGG